MPRVTRGRFTDKVGRLGFDFDLLVLNFALPMFDLVLPRFPHQSPSTSVYFAMPKCSVAKALTFELVELRMNHLVKVLGQGAFLGASPAPKKLDIKANPKTVTLNRVRASCGQPALCDCFLSLF